MLKLIIILHVIFHLIIASDFYVFWQSFGNSQQLFHESKKAVACTTPNNERAFCVSLFTCPVLLKALGTLHPFAIDFVRKSLCPLSTDEDVLVCCGSSGNFLNVSLTEISNSSSNATVQEVTINNSTTEIGMIANMSETIESHSDFVKRELLPSRKYCGYQHTDDRSYTDDSVALDEYPWLVHLIFLEDEDDDPFQFLDRCNGVLISKRYVLTTQSCGNFAKRARLGQYYTNKTVTCKDDEKLNECTDPVLEIPIEEEIHKSTWLDFTLLRLTEKVTFSDYIRPVCLPLEEYKLPKNPSKLYFTGWGATENSDTYKKRLIYKPTNVTECYELDDEGLNNVTDSITPVCAIPDKPNGELACTGDESGPFLFSKRHQWFVDSIVTKVYFNDTGDDNKCSNELPIAGIKITPDVLNWIIQHMKS